MTIITTLFCQIRLEKLVVWSNRIESRSVLERIEYEVFLGSGFGQIASLASIYICFVSSEFEIAPKRHFQDHSMNAAPIFWLSPSPVQP
jgi:hypothetical protein